MTKIYADLGIEIEKVDGTADNSGNLPPGQSGIHPENDNNAGGLDNGGNGNGGGNTGNGNGNGTEVEKFIFYYHPDHLESSS